MKKQIFTFCVLFFACIQMNVAQSTTKLWFDEPATYFEECFVLGNGKLGASVFGGVTSDKIYLNDVLRSNGPINFAKYPPAKLEKFRISLKVD